MASIACPECGKLNSDLRLHCYLCRTPFSETIRRMAHAFPAEARENESRPLSEDTIRKLHRRATYAAEVPTEAENMRAYIVILPRVVSPEPTTHNLSPVIGYEVRLLRHNARFTETDYGYDYDYALNDRSTRVKRIFVRREENEEALQAVLRTWLTDLTVFQRPYEFDSTLVNSDLDYCLRQPERRPHLWERPEDWKEYQDKITKLWQILNGL